MPLNRRPIRSVSDTGDRYHSGFEPIAETGRIVGVPERVFGKSGILLALRGFAPRIVRKRVFLGISLPWPHILIRMTIPTTRMTTPIR